MSRLASLLVVLGLTCMAAAIGAPAALGQDLTAPDTTASLDPAAPGPGGVYEGPVGVELSATDPDGTGPEPATHQVTASGFAWDVTTVEATVGDTVQWDFNNQSHDVCIDQSAPVGAPGFDDCTGDEFIASSLDGDTGGSKTFTAAGSYLYYCSLHEPSMRGTVNVAEGGGEPGSGVDTTEYRVNTDGATGTWQTAENTGAADPFVTSFEVSAEGSHVVEYRSTDVAGNVEETASVAFSIEAAAGPSDVSLDVAPRSKRAKVNRKVALTARLENSGGPATEVEVCAKVKARLAAVTGGRCWWLDELGTGQRATEFDLKPKRAARGKRVKVEFRMTQAGGPSQTRTATLRVARR
jgi:plastocyanin